MQPMKGVVWGFTPKNYHTHSHIHYGLCRALSFMGYDASWQDRNDAPDWDRWPATLFITNQDLAEQLPLRKDHIYVIHGGINHPSWQQFQGYRRLSWNVYIDLHARLHENPKVVWLDDDVPFLPEAAHMDFRWATDLTPPEIEANKPLARVYNESSNVIHYVGSRWFVNEKELDAFEHSCVSSGVQFIKHGAGAEDENYSWMGKSKVVSPEDNQRLIRESRFAPAIIGSHHLTEGYLPCRVLKNISYGCMGVTNSAAVQRMFGGRLVQTDSPAELFFHAREVLPTIPVEQVHSLMDYVAERHTYVNRLNCIFKALDILEAA